MPHASPVYTTSLRGGWNHRWGSARRLYGALACTQFLLRQVHREGDWAERVKAHVATFPASPLLALSSAGFQAGWVDEPLWN